MEAAVNLTALDLDDNDVSDLSPLTGLTSLTRLHLSGNQIADLSPLSGLTSLTELDLTYNGLRDISPLAKLTNLTTLYLYGNKISDISVLANLTNLTVLFLEFNRIVDISPLASLTNLTELHLHGNYISDFSPLDAIVGQLTRYENGGQTFPVNIPDAGLRSAIGQALGIASGEPILPFDMARLTHLRATRLGIVDLTGLEAAVNLTQLELYDNAIVDVSPLANLTNLTGLAIQRNQISDVSPLANLTNLQILLLNGNRIADFSSLAGLSPAWYLEGQQYIPVDIPDAGLRGVLETALGKAAGEIITEIDMRTLTRLQAGDAEIVNLTGLEAAVGLTHLELHENAIVDLTPLAGLIELRALSLQQNQIVDVVPLANLFNLQTLFIQKNLIDDLTPLNALNIGLYVKDPQYVDPIEIPDPALRGVLETVLKKTAGEPIARSDLESLTTLQAGASQIVNLTGLDAAVNLTGLELHENLIVDISPLASLRKLTGLSLNSNLITDVSPLANLTNLRLLFLQNNRIADFSPLDGLNLVFHNYGQQDVPEVLVVISDEGLRAAIETALNKNAGDPITATDMGGLESLSAAGASISDLTGIETAVNLRNLSLADNAISDVSLLSDLTKLTALNLAGNEIVDVAPLANLTNLTELFLANNRITDFSPLDGLVGQLDAYSDAPQRTEAPAETQTSAQDGDAPAESEGTSAEDGEEEETEEAEGNVIPEDIDLGDLANPNPSGNDDVPGTVDPRCDSEDAKPGEPCLEPPPEQAPALRVDINGDGIIDVRDRIGARPAPPPERTALLANYPNPFNPETWIPYDLSKSVDVTVSIYNTQGHLVRQLDVGHQDAGRYRSRSRAAYWDGRNAFGEPVASGVYFYVLTAGDFTATRKMLILK